MITRWKRVLFVALVLALVLPVLAIADPPSLVGRLNLVEGGVSFRPGSLDEWAPAVLNYPLTAGDHLWTDQGSRAELHVGSTAIRLDAGTEISFLNLDEQTVQLGVSEGRLNVRLRRLDPGDAFEIDTPNCVVTLQAIGQLQHLRAGRRRYGSDGVAGKAEVTASGNDLLCAGRAVGEPVRKRVDRLVPPARRQPRCRGTRGAPRVTRGRNRLVSSRYVPREMIGIEDLDDNGSWIVMAGYGPVWAPHACGPGLGAVPVRPMGLGRAVGMDLDRRCPLGFRAVPLRSMGIPRRTLGLDPW